MKLTNRAGSSFSLNIVGYQYPERQDDYWDSNWLVVQIDLQLCEKSWFVIDPGLTTFEVQLLIDWLNQLALNASGEKSLTFTEPYLQFDFITDQNKNHILRVNYRLPPKAGNNSWQDENICIDFPSGQIRLTDAAKELQI